MEGLSADEVLFEVPRLLRLNGDGHGNGYDHDCCGSTTAAITTLAMVTIAAAMATIAEPMSVLDRPPPPTANFINGGVLLSMLAVIFVVWPSPDVEMEESCPVWISDFKS